MRVGSLPRPLWRSAVTGQAIPHISFTCRRSLSSPEKYIEDVRRVLGKERYCFVVVGEGLVDKDGNYVATSSGQIDAFGHAQLGGAGEYLRGLAEQNLGVRARAAKLGIGQRAAAHCSSQTDNDEAFLAGQAAVRAAVVECLTDKMVTLLRGDGDQYTSESGLCDLSEIANGVKMVPEAWINDDGVSLNFQFFKYALPLIQGEVNVPFENGIPKYASLDKIRVGRLLRAHSFEIGICRSYLGRILDLKPCHLHHWVVRNPKSDRFLGRDRLVSSGQAVL